VDNSNRESRSPRRRGSAARLACPSTAIVTAAIIALGFCSGLAFTICCGHVGDFVINITASLAAAFAYNVPRAVHRLGNRLRS
jgi:hypothetical protein